MKIFVSWSGDLSRKYAVFFERWICDVIQGAQTFISTSDIAIGDDWRKEIDAELQANSFGVLIMTPENINSTWLHYEAGALAKTTELARLMPVRVGVSNLDMQSGPLSKFNNVDVSREDMHRLVFSINELMNENRIENERLSRIFDRWWPDFEQFVCENAPSAGAGSRAEKGRSEQVEDLLANLASEIRAMSSRLENLTGAETGQMRKIHALADRVL